MDPQILTRWSKSILTSAARTSSSSIAFTLPGNALDACFVLDVTAGATGTSPTLTVSIDTSPDLGTTFYSCFKFPQITITKSIYRLVTSFNGSGQATDATATNVDGGNQQAITDNLSSRTLLTVAVSTGCPIIPDYMRLSWYISGSAPTFTFLAWVWGNTTARGLVGQ